MNGDQNFSNSDYLIGLLGSAVQQMATRPQRSSVFTTTTATPRELQDMLARRNTIGTPNKALSDALSKRESRAYNLYSALANAPQRQGYGDWGNDFLRAFGGAAKGATDAEIARTQAERELAQQDLETALAYDKAMGDTQTQQQSIGYDELPYSTAAGGAGGAGGGAGAGGGQQVPVITPSYWNQMITNFDASRPSEASYRAQPQAMRKLENMTTFAGDKNESYARQQFDLIKGRNFLPIARNTLKGSGPITDFEDQKYTAWLNNATDPVMLKDTAKMIVDDVALRNNWNPTQKANALDALGLSSFETDLLPQQVKFEPERVKNEGASIDSILQKYGAKRVE